MELYVSSSVILSLAEEKSLDVLENLLQDEDSRLFDYISEIQRQTFIGGYRMAMQLAMECFGKDGAK